MKWFNSLSLTWKIIIILIIILIIYLLYRAYKNKYYPAKDVTLPTDTQSGNITTWNPSAYTDAIYNDLNSVFTPHSATPYESANKLSNSQLVAIYNDWNDRYKAKFSNLDIIDAINGDFTWWNYDWRLAAGAFSERMKTLIPNHSTRIITQ